MIYYSHMQRQTEVDLEVDLLSLFFVGSVFLTGSLQIGVGCVVGKCLLGSSGSRLDRQHLMLIAEAVMGKVHIHILIVHWTPTLSV